MKVILTLTNVASGPFFLVSGKSKVDKYRFARVAGARHQHRLVVDGEKAPQIMDDLALRIPQLDIPVKISFEMEEADLDAGGQIDEKNAQLAGMKQQIENTEELLRQAQRQLKQQTPRGTARITNEQLEMLQERDEMLVLLTPLAGEDDSPLDVIRRLLSPSAPIEIPEPPPVDNAHVAEGAEQFSEPAKDKPKPKARKKRR